MNDFLAMIIAFLLYPGLLFGLVAALVLGWIRGSLRAVLIGWSGGVPLLAPREFGRRLRQNSTLPEGVYAPLLTVLVVMAFVAPLLVLVFLPLPGNRGPGSPTYTADVVAIGVLLIVMPLARSGLGWMIPSPYTRLAATRSARSILGYVVPFAITVAVGAALSGATRLAGISNSTATIDHVVNIFRFHVNALSLGGFTRVLAGITYAFCLPALTKLTPLRTGQGELDLVGSELSELSGRELLLMRLSEWLQLVAAIGFGIVVFVLPFFHTDLTRGLVALGVGIIVAGGIGAWEGSAARFFRRDDLPVPQAIWLGTPTLLSIVAVLTLILSQRPT